MADQDKSTTDKPVEEPKAEEASGTVTPAGDVVTPAGTDQRGRQLYNVKCAACGNQTQVPFQPSGDRPVYCRNCYIQQRRGGMGPGRY